MNMPHADISQIAERFNELAGEVVEIWGDATENVHATKRETGTPPVIQNAMDQLMDALYKLQETKQSAGVGASPFEKNELLALGNYGLRLLSELSSWAAKLGLTSHAREIEGLSFPFALWVVRNGGEIGLLEPVVNALAQLANEISKPDTLALLYRQICEIVEAVEPSISQDQDYRHPERPWRLLLLNRAIIATRSLLPQLMEPAFDSIVELLPEDAAGFFEQGIEQLDIVGYPGTVRRVMETYYKRYGKKRTLH